VTSTVKSRSRQCALTVLITILACGIARAENIDPDNDGSQYAWGENAGWINTEPAGTAQPGVQVDDFELDGYMWGENIGWVSLSCVNTLTCGAVPYGVLNDGNGRLSGYAWCENAGWINFAPASAGVTIDPVTGLFSGRAWSENLGWITFSSAGPVPFSVKTGWCGATTAIPSGTPAVSNDGANWSWPTLGDAGWYEVVSGELAALRNSGGDYTTATSQCEMDNLTGTSFMEAASPESGDGYWYLVRGSNCKGKATYDSDKPSQVGSRDVEIDGSGNDCL
jgi:hypothetical protein